MDYGMIVALVQLGRCGDIVNILPIARKLADDGITVRIYAHRKYIGILDAVGYAEARQWDGAQGDVTGAEAKARADGADVVLATQSAMNPHRPTRDMDNAILQPWERAGMLPLFHELSLVFDRRNTEREREVLGQHWPADLKPGQRVLAFCLRAVTSRLCDTQQAIMRMLLEQIADRGYVLLDLGSLTLDSPILLLPLIERADVLVTVDTLPYHLAYATGTPTIQLVPDRPYAAAPPRWHVIGRWTYEQAMTLDGQMAIADLLSCPERMRIHGGFVEPVSDRQPPVIRHVYSPWTDAGAEDAARCDRALQTWLDAMRGCPSPSILLPFTHRQERSAARIGDADLPYVRDMIDGQTRHDSDIGTPFLMMDRDILLLTNSDLCLAADAHHVIRHALRRRNAVYGHRVEATNGPETHRSHEELRGRARYRGLDWFAFRAGWWRRHGRELMPDMILGRQAWDWALARIVDATGGECLDDRTIAWHEQHKASWKVDRMGKAGNLANLRLAEDLRKRLATAYPDLTTRLGPC